MSKQKKKYQRIDIKVKAVEGSVFEGNGVFRSGRQPLRIGHGCFIWNDSVRAIVIDSKIVDFPNGYWGYFIRGEVTEDSNGPVLQESLLTLSEESIYTLGEPEEQAVEEAVVKHGTTIDDNGHLQRPVSLTHAEQNGFLEEEHPETERSNNVRIEQRAGNGKRKRKRRNRRSREVTKGT